jgi:C4-type Zn-finger protein
VKINREKEKPCPICWISGNQTNKMKLKDGAHPLGNVIQLVYDCHWCGLRLAFDEPRFSRDIITDE